MNHVDRSQQMFPENRGSVPLSQSDNRLQALERISSAAHHSVAREPQDRNKKLPNMLDLPKERLKNRRVSTEVRVSRSKYV